MAKFLDFLRDALVSVLKPSTRTDRKNQRTGSAPPSRPPAKPGPRGRQQAPAGRTGDDRQHGEEVSPGQFGPEATVEVDPNQVGRVRMSYSPSTDGDPDPGEIVWTWVPFEENDGRGKDRPVLIVAAEQSGSVLAVQLTSKDHDGDREFISIGSGGWDVQGRESWVNLDRVVRVHASGMRRETTALGQNEFSRVASALHRLYGWS